MKTGQLLRKTRIKPRRSTLRRGEPTKAEKEAARVHCWFRAHGCCEECGKITPLEIGHLHHEHSKRRFGWMESESQRHVWLCQEDHAKIHNAGGHPCPRRPKP